jgi:AAA15 family ATPase/GTPase
MIKHLKIENFKSIKRLETDCKRINILIGEPNSGKSNFLESLAVFAYCYANTLHDLVRFERMFELFFDQNIDHPVRVETDQLSYEIHFHSSDRSPSEISGVTTTPMDLLDHFYLTIKESEKEILRRGFNDEGNDKTGGSVCRLAIRPYLFSSWRNGNVRRIEPFLWPPYGDNLLSILLTHRDIWETAADMVQKHGIKLVLRQHEGKIGLLKEKGGRVALWPYQALSDTLQRLIFYFAAIETNKDATLLLEEPESHAFPYYTKFLGETIARDSSNQYFIATHNPYFLFSIIEKAPKEDLNVLITHLENEETRIKQLDEKGIDRAFDFDSSIFFNLEELINE